MQQKYIKEIFNIFKKNNPAPQTELNYNNNFTLLIAIVLSAQATDISVNKATDSLFHIIQTPKDVLKLGEENLKKYIKTIGLYNSKAKNIILLSEKLINSYDNKIPKDFNQLIKLAGVGRKTANVFLNCAYGFKTIGVDTHVHRVSNRIGLVNSQNVLETEEELTKIIAENFKLHAHHWLILHGRYICQSRKPKCSKCIINHLCQYIR